MQRRFYHYVIKVELDQKTGKAYLDMHDPHETTYVKAVGEFFKVQSYDGLWYRIRVPLHAREILRALKDAHRVAEETKQHG